MKALISQNKYTTEGKPVLVGMYDTDVVSSTIENQIIEDAKESFALLGEPLPEDLSIDEFVVYRYQTYTEYWYEAVLSDDEYTIVTYCVYDINHYTKSVPVTQQWFKLIPVTANINVDDMSLVTDSGDYRLLKPTIVMLEETPYLMLVD